MVQEDIKSELKKYNKELEKHLQGVKLDSNFSNIDLFDLTDNSSGDMMPIVTNGILDIKTNLDLLRSDMINNVENILIKSMQDNQKKFFEEMNLFTQNLFIKLKSTFSTQTSQLYTNVSELKKETKSINLKFDNLTNKFEEINSEIFELKNILQNKSNFKTDIDELPNFKNKLDEIESRIDNNSDLKKMLLILESKKKQFENDFFIIKENLDLICNVQKKDQKIILDLIDTINSNSKKIENIRDNQSKKNKNYIEEKEKQTSRILKLEKKLLKEVENQEDEIKGLIKKNEENLFIDEKNPTFLNKDMKNAKTNLNKFETELEKIKDSLEKRNQENKINLDDLRKEDKKQEKIKEKELEKENRIREDVIEVSSVVDNFRRNTILKENKKSKLDTKRLDIFEKELIDKEISSKVDSNSKILEIEKKLRKLSN